MNEYANGGGVDKERLDAILERRTEINNYLNKKYGRSRGKNKAEKDEIDALSKEYRKLGDEYLELNGGYNEYANGGGVGDEMFSQELHDQYEESYVPIDLEKEITLPNGVTALWIEDNNGKVEIWKKGYGDLASAESWRKITKEQLLDEAVKEYDVMNERLRTTGKTYKTSRSTYAKGGGVGEDKLFEVIVFYENNKAKEDNFGIKSAQFWRKKYKVNAKNEDDAKQETYKKFLSEKANKNKIAKNLIAFELKSKNAPEGIAVNEYANGGAVGYSKKEILSFVKDLKMVQNDISEYKKELNGNISEWEKENIENNKLPELRVKEDYLIGQLQYAVKKWNMFKFGKPLILNKETYDFMKKEGILANGGGIGETKTRTIYKDGGETPGLITEEQVKDLSFNVRVKEMPKSKTILLHEIITIETFDLGDEKNISFVPFHIIFGDSSLAIFDALGVEELAGLKRSDCVEFLENLKKKGKTERDGSFIAGLCNFSGNNVFMFFNVQRLSFKGFASRVLPHEALHLARLLITLRENEWVKNNLTTPEWYLDPRAKFVDMNDDNEEFFAETLERTSAIAIDAWQRISDDKMMADGGGIDSIEIGDKVKYNGYEYYVEGMLDDKTYILSNPKKFGHNKEYRTIDEIEKYANGGGIDMKAAEGFFLDNEFEMIVAKLKDYLSKYPYIWTKGNKRYVPIEGWQYAAALMGLSSRIVSVSEKENGKWQAEAQVVNRNGVVVCSGFSILNKEEHKWAKKDEDLANFIQTRAVSRALRNCLSYLIKAAGYSTTPSEEMYGLAIEEKKKKGMPSPIKPVKGVEDDFIFDRPEYNDGMEQPISPKEEVPITKYVPREEIPQEDILRKVWAESKANGIIIRSSEFMNEIELALTDETIGIESQIKSLLMESYNWFTENGIILRSKIFMKKFKDSL